MNKKVVVKCQRCNDPLDEDGVCESCKEKEERDNYDDDFPGNDWNMWRDD